MKPHLTPAVILLAYLLPLRAAEVKCPRAVEVRQTLARAVPGWRDGSSGIPTQLAGVTIFDGKPRDGASLVYDQKKTLAREWIATWSLTKGQEYWLSCSYQGTVLTLERRLPPDASHCTVTYERDTQVAGLPAIQAMSCQ